MPRELSSASPLLSGWSPPEFKGRVIARVEKIKTGVRRRIIFSDGRSRSVHKADIARLARQKGAIIANERYARAPTHVKRQISHKSGQRQKRLWRRALNRMQGWFKKNAASGDILPQKHRIERAIKQLETAQVGSMYGRRSRKRKSARSHIDAAWKAAGVERPKGM